MTIALPVVAGLAVGIGFIIIFALIMPFSSSFNVIQRQHLVDLTINGLKANYNVGETIIFSVHQKGGGCAFPDVWIENAVGHKEWSAKSLLPPCPIVEDKKGFGTTWTPDIVGDYVSMNATGQYFVVAKFDNDSVRQGFRVTD